MPHLVREHLWIGNIEDAGKVLEKGSSEFTHILSLLSSPSISFFKKWKSTASIPAKEIRKVYFGESRGGDDCEKEEDGLEESSVSDSEKVLYVVEYAGKDLKLIRMAVPIRDTEKENLLDYLDVCLDFIEESRKQGPVLVHCFAGVSRSAAIITAYLMRSEQLSQEDALESLQQSCHFVCPNDGFLDQLKLFEEMGFKVDHASPTYKRFLLKLLGDSFHQGEKMDISKFGVDPGLQEKNLSPRLEASPIGTVNSTRGYRCKKCRRLIALQQNVVEHVPGEGETSFGNHRKRSDNKADEFGCSSIFILPLRWMKTVVEGKMEEGSLSCVQCDARLGSFNWSGSQCSCGIWITPAFQLYKSRLDISTV